MQESTIPQVPSTSPAPTLGGYTPSATTGFPTTPPLAPPTPMSTGPTPPPYPDLTTRPKINPSPVVTDSKNSYPVAKKSSGGIMMLVLGFILGCVAGAFGAFGVQSMAAAGSLPFDLPFAQVSPTPKPTATPTPSPTMTPFPTLIPAIISASPSAAPVLGVCTTNADCLGAVCLSGVCVETETPPASGSGI